MYSRILDDETLAAVIAAAPAPEDDLAVLARKAFSVLAKETMHLTKARCISDDPILELSVKDLTAMIDGRLTPHMVGRAVRELGLKGRRTADGWRVIWTPRQIEILRGALE